MDTESHAEISPRPHPDTSGTDTGARVDLDLPAFLTAQEAATWLRVSVWAVYDAVNAGTLPAVRVGRAIRIPRHAVAVTQPSAGADDSGEG